MAEINFYLRDNKSKKETGIMMFLSYNKLRIKIKTLEDKINPKYWDNKSQRARQTKDFVEYPEFNEALKNTAATALTVYRKYKNDTGQYPAPETIKHLIRSELDGKVEPETKQPLTLVSFAEQLTKEIKSGAKLSLKGQKLSNSIYKIYNTNTGVLKSYQLTLSKPIQFEDCTHDFYIKFLKYLTDEKKYSVNTLGKHIRTLKAILSEAAYRGLHSKMDFKRFAAMTEEVDNIYLTPEDLDKLYNLDLSDNKRLERVRDLYIVGAWTGLRWSDCSRIKRENIKGDYIEITTQKTGQSVVIPIHSMVKSIMARYKDETENSLPEAYSNQKMNLYLKELGREAELNEVVTKERTKAGIKTITSYSKHSQITTHSMRRSFATNMYNAGIPTLTIMSITSHRTESNFFKYIKITPREHATKLLETWQRSDMKAV